MTPQINRWKLRLGDFNKALSSLQSASLQFKDMNELEKDGLIQRFEFTFELAWKMMQDYLAETGYASVRGPRPSITQMAADGHIDPFVWDEMLEARNSLTHIYNEEKSREVLNKVVLDFIPAIAALQATMNTLA